MARKIRRDDVVLVVAGKDKGKQGKVLRVVEDGERLVVERANMIKRHTRPTAEFQQGGIIEKEAPIHVSNVMLIDPKTGEPCKPKFKAADSSKNKVRFNPKTGESLD